MMIDLFFAIIAGYGFFIGYSRGIIKTILYVLAFFFGFVVAVKFAPSATDILTRVFDQQSPMMYLAGFTLCLALTIIFIRLVAKGMEGILQSANINIINQFFGGLLLASVLTLLYSGLLWFGASARLLNEENTKESITYPFLQKYPHKFKEVIVVIQPTFEDFWNQSLDFIDRMQETSVEKTETEPKIYDIEDQTEDEEPNRQ